MPSSRRFRGSRSAWRTRRTSPKPWQGRRSLRCREGHEEVLRAVQEGARRLPEVHKGHSRRETATLVRLGHAQPPNVHLLHSEEGLPRATIMHYLTNKLGRKQAPGQRQVLSRLSLPAVLRGLCQARRAARARKRIACWDSVPYLNGGLFPEAPDRGTSRQDTSKFPTRHLSASSSSSNKYDWHLDDRPTRTGNEINPDVLGYVFEKVHQPKGDGGVLHERGHHRVHQQEHDHPCAVRHGAKVVQDRLRR